MAVKIPDGHRKHDYIWLHRCLPCVAKALLFMAAALLCTAAVLRCLGAAHANQARIPHVDMTTADDSVARWAPDVVDFAVKKKLYDPSKGVPFSFSDVYDPITFSGARNGEARVYRYAIAMPCPVLRRACCDASGTEIAYDTMRLLYDVLAPLSVLWGRYLCYGVSGTDVGYAAERVLCGVQY
eukprot:3442508-Rhodomonas_salina.8